MVVVDTGHHAPGTNIEFIVALLLRAGKLGAFDFNSRFYADDDLMVGSADPFQLFRIMTEVVLGGGLDAGVAFMLDQCHNIEPKIPGQIRSIMNVQEATAKALLVDQDALAKAQAAGDVLGANAVLMDAYNTDVRPILAEVRTDMGLDPDPMAAYCRVGLPGEDRGGTGRWSAGRVGCLMSRQRTATIADCSPGRNRLGADPTNTNYAGGNTSAKGSDARPGHRRAGGAAVGQGFRRRPRHADRAGSGGAAARPAALAGRRLPGRRARGRHGRGVRLLPARPGWRCAVDRHGDARAGRVRRTSTTCTPTPASPWPRRPTARR